MGLCTLSKTSLDRLVGVHPDLVRVVKTAITLTDVDFGVAAGTRDEKQQELYVQTGKSTTMNSLHLPQKDGFSHAVDLYAYINGAASYDMMVFRRVIQAMFTAAIIEQVQIESGSLWRTFIDSPHFQLNRTYYKDQDISAAATKIAPASETKA